MQGSFLFLFLKILLLIKFEYEYEKDPLSYFINLLINFKFSIYWVILYHIL